MILFLVGFMGSGKSFMVRRLAAITGLPWRDLDQVIEANEGKFIADIFKTDGESYFRAQERHWLEQTSAELSIVSNSTHHQKGGLRAIISTGGGAPCFGDNMDWMNRHGITVWLNPPMDVLLERLERENIHRPVLEGKHGDALRALVTERLRQRIGFYSQARIVVTAPRPEARDILEMIEHA
jgi:shikimate kinase